MLDNAPFLTHKHAGLTIEGYSRAAVQSYWRIAELKLGFDLGAQPWDFMGTANWFITHTHLDHMAALPVYVARRRMMKMEPPTIYLPEYAVEDVRRLLLIMQRLDRGRQNVRADRRQAGPGDRAVARSRHSASSRRRTRFRRSAISSGNAATSSRRNITACRASRSAICGSPGVQVTREIRTPILAYTGDTSPGGLDNYPPVYEAKVLITEMSFIRAKHRREKIHKFGHMHLDDFLERADRFKNELIICADFSTRYHDNEVRRIVEAKLPEKLRERVKLWI